MFLSAKVGIQSIDFNQMEVGPHLQTSVFRLMSQVAHAFDRHMVGEA